jgi:hypothetical protein
MTPPPIIHTYTHLYWQVTARSMSGSGSANGWGGARNGAGRHKNDDIIPHGQTSITAYFGTASSSASRSGDDHEQKASSIDTGAGPVLEASSASHDEMELERVSDDLDMSETELSHAHGILNSSEISRASESETELSHAHGILNSSEISRASESETEPSHAHGIRNSSEISRASESDSHHRDLSSSGDSNTSSSSQQMDSAINSCIIQPNISISREENSAYLLLTSQAEITVSEESIGFGIPAHLGSSIRNFIKSVLSKFDQDKDNIAKKGFWIFPPDPAVQILKSMAEDVNPFNYYLCRIFIFRPDIFYRGVKIYCPSCHSSEATCLHGEWAFRKVIDSDHFYIICGYRYICKTCKRSYDDLKKKLKNSQIGKSNPDISYTFSNFHPYVLQMLPEFVKSKFPAFLTSRSGIDKKLLRILVSSINSGMSFNCFAQMIQENHKSRYDECILQYFDLIRYFRGLNSIKNIKNVYRFSDFDDNNGYNGMNFSANYFEDIFKANVSSRVDYIQKRIEIVSGEILSGDHSFKLPGWIYTMGTNPFSATYIVLNEFSEIVTFGMLPSKGHEDFKPLLKNLAKRYETHRFPMPKLFYTDDCCKDKHILMECIPSLALDYVPFSEFPLLKIPDATSILFSNCHQEISDICEAIIELIEADPIVFGVDMEWNVDISSGSRSKVSLVQIAKNDCIYVFHLKGFSSCPKGLRNFMQEKRILKVGRNIGGDASKFFADYGVSIESTVELGALAKKHGAIKNGNISLSELCKTILKCSLDKTERLSDWNAATLSESSVKYAARDAFASYMLYQTIMGMPDLKQRLGSDSAVLGTPVAIHASALSNEIIAFGIISGNFEGKKLAHRCKVSLKTIFRPSFKLKYPKVDVLTFGDTGIDGEIVIDIKFLRKLNSLHQDDQEILTVPQEDIQSENDSVPFTRIKQVSVCILGLIFYITYDYRIGCFSSSRSH